MKAGAGLSTTAHGRTAAVEAALEARTALDGATADLALVFASPHFASDAASVLDAVHEAAGPGAVVGCVAEGVVGGAREIESEAAVSVWLAALGAPVETFHATFARLGDAGAFSGWPEADGSFLLLCDPASFPADALLDYLNEHSPRTRVVGGLAGAGGRGGARLFVDRDVVTGGAVGVRLPDDVSVVPLVSQGCRPVGSPLTVTKAEGNVIYELAGKPPVEHLRTLYASLPEDDRRLLGEGLLLGRIIDEYKSEFEAGDFLVRAVMGADADNGAIAVGDVVDVGEAVQFHVRDARSADDDLRATLAAARAVLAGRSASGALLFTCNGRGVRMFGAPDHDARLVAAELGAPVAGFFCAGELGPVGGRNFLHGFTASLAVFADGA
ncbi:MAG TPA: FIST N-terminal domain-containing protein [Actinomycetota bacterium]|nr:FIST N-terminal domain-containing protein [Actinomycetota bacterium]